MATALIIAYTRIAGRRGERRYARKQPDLHLQPCARQRYFIENPVGIIDEYHIFKNVSERKAQFGERCILTALRE